MNNGNGRPISFNRTMQPQLVTGLTRAVAFQIPRHPQSSLLLEWVSIINKAAVVGVNANDVFNLRALFAPNIDQAINRVDECDVRYLQAYTVVGTGTAGFNPNLAGGFKFDPPFRLSPNDDPFWITLRNSTTASDFSGVACAYSGWEIPTLDLGTFPAPDSFESIL